MSTAEEQARAGLQAHADGNRHGWLMLVEASKAWRAEGDAARGQQAEDEARRLRAISSGLRPGELDIEGARSRLGL